MSGDFGSVPGYFEANEFETMVDVLYDTGQEDEKKGFLSAAKTKLEVSEDGRVDFREMNELVKRFPNFWYPVFRLQNKTMARFVGHNWWRKKKEELHKARVRHSVMNDIALQTELALERIRQRRIRRQMGIIRYNLLPCRRAHLEEICPKREVKRENALEEKDDEEATERKKEQRKEMNRLDDITVKNQETLEWHQYIQRKQRDKDRQVGLNLGDVTLMCVEFCYIQR